jgi:short-subunit dehydrogenase
MAVEFPLPYIAGYNVAKAGLAALCESLLLEADPLGINVLDFRPGDYRTGFNQSMYASLPADLPHQVRRIGIHLDRLLAEAPLPEKAASDLYRALRNRRSGVVRSGTFFQTALAPFLVRFCTQRLRRFFMNRHFGAT